jgi:hypothetical protein
MFCVPNQLFGPSGIFGLGNGIGAALCSALGENTTLIHLNSVVSVHILLVFLFVSLIYLNSQVFIEEERVITMYLLSLTDIALFFHQTIILATRVQTTFAEFWSTIQSCCQLTSVVSLQTCGGSVLAYFFGADVRKCCRFYFKKM